MQILHRVSIKKKKIITISNDSNYIIKIISYEDYTITYEYVFLEYITKDNPLKIFLMTDVVFVGWGFKNFNNEQYVTVRCGSAHGV